MLSGMLPTGALARVRFAHLRMVLSIADNGTMHKASIELSVTQPALTRSLKELETTLGVSLFNRNQKGMQLTPAGVQFARHSRIILNQYGAAIAQVNEFKDGIVGDVKIAMLPAVTPRIMPAVVKQLDELDSNIHLTLSGGPSSLSLPRLLNGDLDMIVGRLHPDSAPDLKKIPLIYDGISIVCRPNHPLLSKRKIHLKQLLSADSSQDWILPSDSDSLIMHDISRTLTHLGLSLPQNPLEVHSVQAIRKILRDGDRLAILSTAVAEEECSHGLLKILPADFEAKLTPIGITMRSVDETSPAAQFVVGVIRQVCGSI